MSLQIVNSLQKVIQVISILFKASLKLNKIVS